MVALSSRFQSCLWVLVATNNAAVVLLGSRAAGVAVVDAFAPSIPATKTRSWSKFFNNHHHHSKTSLGFRRRQRRREQAVFWELEEPVTREWTTSSSTGGEGWQVLRESVRELTRYKERKRSRKLLKILYALGFFFTFPVGPLVFLTIRHRDSILQDLRLPSRRNSDVVDKEGANNIVSDESLLEQSRQVDQAIEKSRDVWKQVRDDMRFDEALMQKLDEEIETLLLTQSFDSQTLDGSIEKDRRLIHEYETKRKDALRQKTELRQKIERERTKLQILEDSVWDLQSRASEINSQIREVQSDAKGNL